MHNCCTCLPVWNGETVRLRMVARAHRFEACLTLHHCMPLLAPSCKMRMPPVRTKSCTGLNAPLRNQLQFKCDSEKNKFWKFTVANKVNLWKYVEIMQHNTEIQKSAISYFCPKMETEHMNTKVIMFKQTFCWHNIIEYGYRELESSTFWDITLCGMLKVNRHFGGTCHLHLCSACYLLHDGFLLGLFFSSEDGSDMFLRNIKRLQQTTWHYIPEDRTLHDHCCEKLKYYTELVTSLEHCLPVPGGERMS
jgi:hypothetical protein